MALEIRNPKDLIENPLNPRGPIDVQAEDIAELSGSIADAGLLQPILITPDGVIIAGHRRRAACILAGLVSVEVLVKDISERDQLEIMLIENIQRRDLSCVQMAVSFQKLQERGLSIIDIATKVGFGKDTVRKHLDILKLPAEIHPLFASGQAALGYIWPLLDVKEPKNQIALCKQAVQQGWLNNQLMCEIAIFQNRDRPTTNGKAVPYKPPTRVERMINVAQDAANRLESTRANLRIYLAPELPIFGGLEKCEDWLRKYSGDLQRQKKGVKA